MLAFNQQSKWDWLLRARFLAETCVQKKGSCFGGGRTGSDASRRGRDVLGLLPLNLVIVRRLPVVRSVSKTKKGDGTFEVISLNFAHVHLWLPNKDALICSKTLSC